MECATPSARLAPISIAPTLSMFVVCAQVIVLLVLLAPTVLSANRGFTTIMGCALIRVHFAHIYHLSPLTVLPAIRTARVAARVSVSVVSTKHPPSTT